MTSEMLDAGIEFGRYLDSDDDGITYRTYPGTHATKGVYFTRGTTKDRYAKYSEAGPDYVENMERLDKKFKTAASYVPPALVTNISEQIPRNGSLGIIYYGSTAPAMDEAFVKLEQIGIHADGLRIRAFPFGTEVEQFLSQHSQSIIVEKKRNGQLRALLIDELEINPANLIPVLHYDGTPITADFIANAIRQLVQPQTDADVSKAASN